MQKVISIGKQNFVSLRENDCFYIDKTDLICKWWESKDEIHDGKTFLKDWQSGKRKSIVKCKEPIR